MTKYSDAEQRSGQRQACSLGLVVQTPTFYGIGLNFSYLMPRPYPRFNAGIRDKMMGEPFNAWKSSTIYIKCAGPKFHGNVVHSLSVCPSTQGFEPPNFKLHLAGFGPRCRGHLNSFLPNLAVVSRGRDASQSIYRIIFGPF